MIRIATDTNILVSALIAKGKPRALMRKIVKKKLILVLSKEMMGELKEVVKRPKFEMSNEEINKFIKAVAMISEMVDVKSNFKVVKEDPDDDIVLNTAYDGGANYIVSGNDHLLKLREFKGIKIVTVDDILKLLK